MRDLRVNLILRILSKWRRPGVIPSKAALTKLFHRIVRQHENFKPDGTHRPPATQAEGGLSSVLGPGVEPTPPPTEPPTPTFQVFQSLDIGSQADRSRSPAPSQFSDAKSSRNSARDSVVVLRPGDGEEFQKVYKQAKSYIGRGQFGSAAVLCKRAQSLLPTQNHGKTPMDLDRVRIQMQIEIITLLSGSSKYYPDAEESLKRLKEDCKTLGKSEQKIHVEVGRWLAESLALQGKYREAANELNDLKLPELRTTQWFSLTGPVVIGAEDIAALRNLAHTLAYLGFFTRAQLIIKFLLRYLDERIGDNPNVPPSKGKALVDGSEMSVVPESDNLKTAELVNVRDSVFFSAAVIYTLSGNYTRALKMATEAWRGRKERLGGHHVKTLEAASLRAHILALTSRSQEAEGICMHILRTLSSSELSPYHLQAIRTKKTLVLIFRNQFRLVEAVDTGRSLCEMATKSMTDFHPETLKARMEFASSLRSAGDYAAAEGEYAAIVAGSHKVYKDDPEHPETLRCESELAHVYACMGRLDDAEGLALDTLRKQHHAYQFERPGTPDDEVNIKSLEKPKRDVTSNDAKKDILAVVLNDLKFEYALDECLEWMAMDENPKALGSDEQMPSGKLGELIDEIKQRFTEILAHSTADTSTLLAGIDLILAEAKDSPGLSAARDKLRSLLSQLRVHPSLLYTVHLLAWIKLRKQDTDAESICLIIETVLQWRRKTLGDYHDLTLVSEYDLAMAKRECNKLEEARLGFQTIFIQRHAQLGKSHPDTLSSKRELIITSSALSFPFQDPDSILSLNRETSNTSTERLGTDETSNTTVDDSNTSNPTITLETSPNISPPHHHQHPQVLLEQPLSPDEQPPMSLEDWTKVESHSLLIAAEQASRIGASHPETINTLLWVFAVQLLIGKISEGTQTMTTLLTRLRQQAVREQRRLNSLQAEEKIAWICLEQNLVGFGVDILHAIVREVGSEGGGKGKGMGSPKELEALERRCREKIARSGARDEAESSARTMVQMSEEVSTMGQTRETSSHKSLLDKDVYVVNVLRLAYRAGLGERNDAVKWARFHFQARLEELAEEARSEEVDGKKGAVELEKAFVLLQTAFPERMEDLTGLRAEAKRFLVVGGEGSRRSKGLSKTETAEEGKHSGPRPDPPSKADVGRAFRLLLDFWQGAGHVIEPG